MRGAWAAGFWFAMACGAVPAAAGDSAGTSAPDPAAAASMPARTDSALIRSMASGHLRAARDGGGPLVPGPLFSLGRIRVASAPGFTDEELGIAAYAGEPADAENLKAIGERVRAYLLDYGHPFASVAIDFSAREDEPVADLAIVIEAGDGYKFGGFKHSGSRTRPEVLDRLSLLRYGETYSEARLRLAGEKLSRTGYYEAVVPGSLFRDSTRNLLYPSLVLTDLKGNRLSGILGYDSEKKGESGLNGYLDIHLINLRGTARDLDFTFDSKQTGEGVDSREARLAYTEPWLLTARVGAHAEGHIFLEDSVYTEASGELTLFQDLDFRSRYLLALASQTNHDFLAGTRSDAEIAGLGFQYDARDRVPGTLRGARFSVRVNGVHRDLGDTAYFLVQSIDEVSLWGNVGRWVGHAQFSGSGNWPLEGRSNRGELYSLGGANSVRGFREREFLTNLFLYGNFEMQFLLAPKSRASVFVVPAFINRLGGDVDWRRVVGYGLGIESGAKDWTFGVSYALNPDRSIGDGFVHLRATNNF
ncbi:MAG TPA: POTRA domain-containing protein [Fibrobacteria bacterium]|nr:POTRA domain-containing protein [Fibrobacteria bacterium]